MVKISTDQQIKIYGSDQSSKRIKVPATSSSQCNKKKKYKGVRMRSWGSWVSEIRAPNQKTRIWLGSYSTPEAAARAHDAALLCLKGSSSAAANLNFPNTINIMPRHCHHNNDTVLSPKSIQRLAAAAAANTSPTNITSSPSDDQMDQPIASTMGDQYSTSSWYNYNFDDPRDQIMFNGTGSTGSFNNILPTMDNLFYEEDGDIRLWSFY